MAFDAQGNYIYNPGDLSFNSLENAGSIFDKPNNSIFNSNNLGGGNDTVNPNVNNKTGYNPYIQGISAVSGLANAYLGFENLDLSKKQFAFTKDSFNTNLANQASLTNTQLEAQQNARLSGEGNYDRSTAEGRNELAADLEKYLAPRRVDGSPV